VFGLFVRLAGGFELVCGEGSVSLPMSARRLVAFVALHERPLLRSFVAGTLWIDLSEERAGASLRSALWRVHRPGHALIEASPTHLQLSPGVGVDVRMATAFCRRILDHGDDRLDFGSFEQLTEDLLPDWYDEWVVVARERFRHLRLHALEALSQRLTAAGRIPQAIQAGLAAVAAEPLRESAHRTVIRAHLSEGNVAEAIAQFRKYRELLQTELGIQPSRRMEELMAPIQKADGMLMTRR
jgi:DNA-binding SARP family transcriptional activator